MWDFELLGAFADPKLKDIWFGQYKLFYVLKSLIWAFWATIGEGGGRGGGERSRKGGGGGRAGRREWTRGMEGQEAIITLSVLKCQASLQPSLRSLVPICSALEENK